MGDRLLERGNGSFKMDMLDWDIIELLQKESGMSLAQISRRLGLPQPSIADRINRLAEGLMDWGPISDSQAPNSGVSAFLRLGVREPKLLKRLSKTPEVRECHRIGEPNVFQLKIIASNLAHLRRWVDKLKTFGDGLTAIVISRRSQLSSCLCAEPSTRLRKRIRRE